MALWLYCLACVVVPAGWGILMYFVFNTLTERGKRDREDDRPPPVDYSI